MSSPEGLCQWCRKAKHPGDCSVEALKEIIHDMRALEAARQKIPGDNVVMIRSLISRQTKKPRIDLQLGQAHTQMETWAAQKVAIDMLHAAAGSFADAYLYHFITAELNQSEETGHQLIGEFRAYRETLQREFEAYQVPGETT